MLFSILIPAYNAEKYIINCINSIKKQTFEDWECIIIDDGSKDNTYNIIVKNVINDKRFIVEKQLNQGVANTRNNLLKMAKGDYIVWIDADDFVSETMLYNINKNILKYKADLLIFNYNIVDEEKIASIRLLNRDDGIIGKKEVFRHFAEECNMPSFLCNKIFNKNLFNNIAFDNSLKMLEDYEVMISLVSFAQRIVYLNDYLYNYRQIDSSITHNIDEHIIKRNLTIRNEREKVLLKFFPDLINSVKIGNVYITINYIIIAKQNEYVELFKQLKEQLKKNIFIYLLSNDIKLKEKIKATLICINFNFYNCIKNLINR